MVTRRFWCEHDQTKIRVSQKVRDSFLSKVIFPRSQNLKTLLAQQENMLCLWTY
jgi:hypothetical protein